jgi:hypothetical protein
MSFSPILTNEDNWLVVTGTGFPIQLGIVTPTDELHHFSEG